MTNTLKSSIAALTLISAFSLSACKKETLPQNKIGTWVITWFTGMKVTAPQSPALCTAGADIVLNIAGTVSRSWQGTGYVPSQTNVPLLLGDRSINKDANSVSQYINCDDLSVVAWNRSYTAVTLLGALPDGFGTVTQDSSGRCVLHINRNATNDWMTVWVDYAGSAHTRTTNGTTYTDSNNKQSAFSYNCKTGNYIQQL
jgi:hypothetical protein